MTFPTLPTEWNICIEKRNITGIGSGNFIFQELNLGKYEPALLNTMKELSGFYWHSKDEYLQEGRRRRGGRVRGGDTLPQNIITLLQTYKTSSKQQISRNSQSINKAITGSFK